MNIFIADNHPLFREGLRLIISNAGQGGHFTECASIEEILTLLRQGRCCDLLLLDLDLPGMEQMVGLSQLVAEFPEVKIIIVTSCNNPIIFHSVMDNGAKGFVSKHANSQELMFAIWLVHNGQKYIPRQIMQTTLTSGANQAEEEQQLTLRQRQILALLNDGATNKDISDSLNLSLGTVKVHIHAIIKVLGVTNRTTAIKRAKAIGWL